MENEQGMKMKRKMKEEQSMEKKKMKAEHCTEKTEKEQNAEANDDEPRRATLYMAVMSWLCLQDYRISLQECDRIDDYIKRLDGDIRHLQIEQRFSRVIQSLQRLRDAALKTRDCLREQSERQLDVIKGTESILIMETDDFGFVKRLEDEHGFNARITVLDPERLGAVAQGLRDKGIPFTYA